ncbi:MAG: protein kinase [Schwartzia sp.]|nr:protein kinase [Schwartzia sp. (in: firmicutes)]
MDRAVENYIAENFEKYRLLRKTERSEVWLAGAASGTVVVLKRIFDDGLPYKTLEAHPHPLWPKILYCAESPGETVVIEEFAAGVSLRERLEQLNYFTEEEAARVLLRLCDGLAVLHELGVIHRDIKPSNLILTEEGAVRLIDFDAARTQKEDRQEDTTRLGTKGYAPPEQFGYGQTDARSDLYAVGVTMTKMLGPDYHGVLMPVLTKCTELDPKHRYASARELKRAVLMRRRWAKAKMSSVVLLALLVGAVLYLLPSKPTPPVEPPPTPSGTALDRQEPVKPTPVEKETPASSVPEPTERATTKPTPDEDQTEPPDMQQETIAESEPRSVPASTEAASESNTPHETLTADEEAEAFLALFADDPERQAYWRERKEANYANIEKRARSRREAEERKRAFLDEMRRIELGRRAEAFEKTLPKTMTRDEKGRAFNAFVFEQIEILGITDF